MQLVVQKPGTLITQKDECFRLKNRDDRLDLSPLKVESIVISNQAMISSQAVVLALEHNIDVIFLDGFGDPLGRIWFSKMGSTTLIRRKQLEAANNGVGLTLVRDMIRQKLENQSRFLKKLMHARPGREDLFRRPVKTIEQETEKLALADQPPETVGGHIRGLEGASGAAYFQCVSKIMPKKYQFEKRSRRPAGDPFNAALNYCYGILYSQVEKACILSGLDPYVGFLHTDDYNKKSLVFDLIEPFRIFAEQNAVYLFTGRKMKDEYFDMSDGGVSLNKNGKPVVVDAMNGHLEESVRYRGRNVKRRHIIRHEAHRMANLLLADEDEDRPDWLEIQEF
ncbi:CRISPR-associated endonuclease Cas1 [Desulfonema ishimotonii]|uniref:CRISPR-associated endonuclease Cas1 n=1 Tax=Desulfonema ishimotonii TaxID=45657 RepID=A0A401FUK7_9BACT|nr:CRISPR-associated endonuclease Cas1 [Desulfonema ishimotonii]GBC60645.1 CRISPR-associated endonuclease Cas1 [Desulfonema ishimotonii]